MSSPSPPKKTGVIICGHCQLPIKKERIRLAHFFEGKKSVELNFCGGDCMKDYLYDSDIHDEINQAVEKEKAWLHKQVCPACKRRIT